jgi:hypothetical protein
MDFTWDQFYTAWYRHHDYRGHNHRVDHYEPTTLVYTSACGARIIPNGTPIDTLKLDTYLELLNQRWTAATGWDGVRNLIRHLAIFFMPGTFATSQWPKVDGLALLGSYAILVTWMDDLDQSALCHEVGHMILWQTKKDATEEGLESFCRFHKLPY